MVDFINALVTKLKTVPGIKHAQIYNTQFDYLENGGGYSFPFPCAFVEVLHDDFRQLGSGYQGIDLDVIIHLGVDFYNGSQMDDNLDIFALRAEVVKALNFYKHPQSGPMLKLSESQDLQHTNVYHYSIRYKTHFIDTTAVATDILTTPPTNLNIE